MDTGLRGWAADHTDGLTRTFARAGVGLSTLTANRQAAQVTNAAIAFDALQALEVHADFAAQVAFDDILTVLNGMNNLGKLLLGQVLGPNGRVNIRPGQDVFRVARADAVDITQRDIDTLVRRNFYTNDTCHKSGLELFLALALLVTRVGANHTNNAFALNNFAILAKLFD